MPANPEFLFVNKNAQSARLTQSSASEKKDIYRHAQLYSITHSGRSTGAPWRAIDFSKDAQRPGDKFERLDELDTTIAKKTHTIRPKAIGYKRGRQSAPQVKVSAKERQAILRVRDGICPSLSPPLDLYLRQVYDTNIAPLLFPIPAIADTSGAYTLALASEDRFMHHAFSYLMCTRLSQDSRQSLHQFNAIASKQKALLHLRRLVSETADGNIRLSQCYAIGILIWAESLAGNLEDMRAHVSGLEYLYPRALVGVHVPAYILRIIFACAYLCAEAIRVSPPIQPPRVPTTSELSPAAQACLERLNTSDLWTQGHAFFRPACFELLGPHLARVISDYQEVVFLRDNMVRYSGDEVPADIDLQFVTLKEAMIEHHLQALQLDKSLDARQHALRLALLIYSSIPVVAATGSSSSLSRILAQNLHRYLENADLLSHWESSSDILLWVLTIGAFVSREGAERSWFETQIIRNISSTGISSLPELETRLRGCYYSKYLEPTARAMWSKYDSLLEP